MSHAQQPAAVVHTRRMVYSVKQAQQPPRAHHAPSILRHCRPCNLRASTNRWCSSSVQRWRSLGGAVACGCTTTPSNEHDSLGSRPAHTLAAIVQAIRHIEPSDMHETYCLHCTMPLPLSINQAKRKAMLGTTTGRTPRLATL